MSPLASLRKSRKFLILVLDTVISLALFFVGKYAMNAIEDVKFLILALQPVAVAIIYSIAVEDAAEKARAPA